MSQEDQSIWGAINTSLEIALNVYYLVCEQGSGIRMSAATAAGNSKLREYIQMGDREGDELFFPESSPAYAKVREAVEQMEVERAATQAPPEAGTLPAHAKPTDEASPPVVPPQPLQTEADLEDEWDGFEP